MKKYTYVPGSFIAAWLIWELIVRLGGFNEALLPTPYKVLIGFGELIGDGVLFKDIADSLVRFFIGYIISVVAGVFFGLILGWYKGIWNYINPIVQVIRPISPVAWLPFIVLFFGIGQAPAIVIIFIAAFFPVLLSTVSAIQNIDPVYIKVARNFGIKQPELLFVKIIIFFILIIVLIKCFEYWHRCCIILTSGSFTFLCQPLRDVLHKLRMTHNKVPAVQLLISA